ncbi:MAG: NAD(P)/FAD-dependent oxidoreductase [Bacteroidia bacterium]
MQISFWEHEVFFKDIDVAIIGSGIVGLSAALHLKTTAPELNVIVLERGVYPYGASTRNAGFACFGTLSEICRDLDLYPDEEVFKMVEKRWNGLLNLRAIVGDEKSEFEMCGSHELFFSEDQNNYNKYISKLDFINNKIEAITGIGENFAISGEGKTEYGFKNVTHLIESKAEGLIHSGKTMKTLMKRVRDAGVEILNGIEINSFNDEGTRVLIKTSNNINIFASKLLIATNGFTNKLIKDIDVVPARGQVIVTSPIMNLKVKGAFHFNEGYYYFRNVGNRILFGGGRNLNLKAEETSEMGLTETVQQKLEYYLKEVILPETHCAIDFRWSGIMGMGSSRSVLMQNITDNVSCAVRLSGTGIAIGTLIGKEAAENILTKISN